MNTLVIKHLDGTVPARFQVVRLSDAKSANPVEVVSPYGFPVQDRPHSDLMHELQWYLETFLDYPFPPVTDRADRVLDSLRNWGRQAFNALFGARESGRLFDDATRDGYAALSLHVSSDDPGVLAWPWEALLDPQAEFLAQTCQIERRLNQVRDPVRIAGTFPDDKVNILLVTARPYEGDVRYRSISRPLVELVKNQGLAAQVHVLRPPTFDRLRDHLRERPNFYHILHFDGHGGYGTAPARQGYAFRGPEGVLVFEKDDGNPDPVQARTLSMLLREHRIPAVVLNACQSAMIDQQAADPFASVAASLLQSGIHNVVAMAYSLYVSGAQVFLPAFYRRLFDSGAVAEAARAGRQQMLAHPERVCARGRFPLSDWLVPVLYQQDPFDFSFAKIGKRAPVEVESALPEEARQESPYGFIGRDGPLLDLERAMRLKPAAILVHGLAGVGKTTLAQGFVRWLDDTEGLGNGCFWFRFDELRSAEFVFNRMGEALFSGAFGAAKPDEKIAALADKLKNNPFLIVWDNFEVVRGIPGTAVQPTLPEEDARLLLDFLRRLRGGKTKVLITSRSEEDWLGIERLKIAITGLEGEERWDYCDAILRDLNIRIPRDDKDLVRLMDLLDGHPLSMRVILPKLETLRPADAIAALESNFAALGPASDETQAKLHATLRLAEQSLPDDLRPLLTPLALHERFVDGDYLEAMAQQVEDPWTRDRINRFLDALAHVGLLRDRGQSIFEIHPALTGFLRSTWLDAQPVAQPEPWARAFVDVLGSLADALAPRELHEQRPGFHLHGANFHHALHEAERLDMQTHFRAFTQALAFYAQNQRNFSEAARLFQQLAQAHITAGAKQYEAAAYHQLGMIAEEQRDFTAAEQWYRKSLAINEKQGNEHGAAQTYHQLGRIAQEQRDFPAAEQWYRKSLAIKEKHGNEHGAAQTYHQLGMIAEEQRDFPAAEQWYRKSLAIKEKQGNEHGAAMTYHQLGIIGQERRDFPAAEQWYRKAVGVFDRLGIEHHAAITYHQLGIIAQEQRDFPAADQWYRKSLAIEEKHGNEHGAASTYHQLGIIAQEQRDFPAAEQWYRKSLAIKEKQGNERGAALTYGQLGIVAGLQGQFEESGRWLIRSIVTSTRANDPHTAQRNTRNFMVNYDNAPPSIQPKLKAIWDEAGLGPFPKP